MKKILQLIVVLGLFSLTNCGPTEEEKAKMEQEATAAVDSLMNALESEMSTDSAPVTTTQEEQTTTQESEEAPKQ